MSRDEILEQLANHRKELQQYKVRSLALFGSAARDEAGPSSDVDLLVEFQRPVGLFDFVRLKSYIESLLRQPVDLVTPDALKQSLKSDILKEAIHAL